MTEATFTDSLGETRVVRKVRPGRWQVKQPSGQTVSQAVSYAIGSLAGPKIRAMREEKGMTQAELAIAAGLSASCSRHAKQRIYSIENGGDGANRTQGVKLGTLYAIAHALDCSPCDLLPNLEEAMAAAGISKSITLTA